MDEPGSRLIEKAGIRTLLDAIPDPELAPRRVGMSVGNVRNNGPELTKTVDT